MIQWSLIGKHKLRKTVKHIFNLKIELYAFNIDLFIRLRFIAYFHKLHAIYCNVDINVLQAGSWAGNLMMKHQHPEFPSDMFVMLETVNAQIVVGK